MSLRDCVARVLGASPFLASINYFKSQCLCRLGIRRHESGATHIEKHLDSSVAYVKGVFSDYLQYAGVREEDLQGKRVLEIGCGDNLGVALLFIAKGSQSVMCLDRFEPIRDERRNSLIYRRLMEGLSPAERARVHEATESEGDADVRFRRQRIDCRYNTPIERAQELFREGSFDLVVSRAVLEHVYDLDAAWDAMVSLLAEDGEMWHKVDLRSHGMFSQFHPLYFLTLQDWLWNLVSSPDPTLNRQRMSAYVRLAKRTFSTHKVFVTHTLDNGELLPHQELTQRGLDYGEPDLLALGRIRSRLAPRFKAMMAEDLLVSGIFLICRSKRRSVQDSTPRS